MPIKGTRYGQARNFTAPSAGRPAFVGVRPRIIARTMGVIEHVVQPGDRLDLLALNYYNNDRLWWRIADANPGVLFAADLVVQMPVVQPAEREVVPDRRMEGQVILIPPASE